MTSASGRLVSRLGRAVAAFFAADAPLAPSLAKPAPRHVSPEALAYSRTGQQAKVNPFAPAKPMPGVVPEGSPTMAMDWGSGVDPYQWAGGLSDFAFNGGLTFFGYPALAELAQRPEYRMIVDTLAMELTREWIEFQSAGSDDKASKDEKLEKIKKIQDEMDRLGVRDAFRKIASHDGYFGRAHLYIDTGASDKPEELKTPIGDGRNDSSKSKIGKGGIKAFRAIEPVWTYPQTYNANNPLTGDWYKPQSWFVLGKEIHVSRLLHFVGREVPDILKPAYAFGGMPMTQMAKPYVDNWIKTRKSVADGISAYSVFVLKTNLAESLMTSGDGLLQRLQIFVNYRDNRGLMAIDKENEELTNVAAPLTGLDLLQAQAQEHMASVSGIPLVKLLGISPHGLNASAEPELRAFYERVLSFQESFFRPNLTKVVDFVQLSLFGEIDQEITFRFVPLWSLSEKEEAEIRKSDAETDQIHVDLGALSPQEVRTKITNDPASPYHGLDPDELPDLDLEEAEGLVIRGGRGAGAESTQGAA